MSESDGTPRESDPPESDESYEPTYWDRLRYSNHVDDAIVLMSLQVVERILTSKPYPFRKGSRARYPPVIRAGLHRRLIELIESYDKRVNPTETDT